MSSTTMAIKPEYMGGVEAVIVLGGDGTMLRAAHSIGTYDVPLMGVNLGTLGFLTEVEESNAYKAIDRLLADDYSIEKRMMIEGRKGDILFLPERCGDHTCRIFPDHWSEYLCK